MKIFLYDVETTGLNSTYNAIIELAGLIIIDGILTGSVSYKARPFPGQEINEKALRICGKSLETVLSYEDPTIVFSQLISTLDKYVDRYDRNDKFFLAGWNNSKFDNAFLRQFFLNNDHKYYGSYFWESIDVMHLANIKLAKERNKLNNMKLSTVATYLGVKVDESKLHGADYDCHLTYEIYKRLTTEE